MDLGLEPWGGRGRVCSVGGLQKLLHSLTTVTYRHMPSHTATYGHVVCLLCGRPPEIVDAVTEATLAVELCEYVNA